MITYVTRARRDWIPGERSHPGYDEFEDGTPTGRVVFAPVKVVGIGVNELRSGLCRDLETDRRFRDMIDKLNYGINLSDAELRALLQFYGTIVRFSEIIGDSYHLVTADATSRHRLLIEIAEQRGWTQSMIDMLGVMVEGGFGTIL
jgi:hypothetical protein